LRPHGAHFQFATAPFLESKARNMPTQRKEASVAKLAERLSAATNLFFTDYQGLTVDEITRLRGELRKDGSTYAVVKNTLFRIAAGDLSSQVEEFLAGPTGVVFAGADPVAPAKALKTFSDTVKKVGIKAAYIDGRVVDAAQVETLAKLPGRHARESAARTRDGAFRQPAWIGSRTRRDPRTKSISIQRLSKEESKYHGTCRTHRSDR
jgi:large subunit ribosomal protein L10